ncbi:MAG: pheromone processing endoprotease [Bogoriella megaspora]|nr:MAG: pheromone processing endoprotease [Bogoriella megaspora]
MRLAHVCAGLLSIARVAYGNYPTVKTYDTHDYYALHVDPSTSPHDLATYLGLDVDGPLGHIKDHYLFKTTKHDHDIVENAKEDLKRRRRKRDASWHPHVLDGILLNQKQQLKKRLVKRIPPPPLPLDERSRVDLAASPSPPRQESAVLQRNQIASSLGIKDPIWNEQWHLFNTEQPGNDLNVTALWKDGITGKNATVCFVDDGLDMDSDDLRANYFAQGSYDFNDKGPDPRPRLSDDKHGTRCAGEVSAVKNDVCGVGVAWDSKVAALRILSAAISDADEATAMTYAFQDNMIYSCSWGPPDDGRSMDAPGILIKRAMVTAIQEGRGGLGTIYVFAAGNGAAADDNCNFDGYTNSIYSITVGAIDRMNQHPYYSESCSAQLVVTYSSGSGDSIHTTDVGSNGNNKCYSGHGGTSAAGPLAVGVYALALQVKPDLTWRDMQWLSVLSAVPLDEANGEWQTTPLGKKFSHAYGYGKLDAWALVNMAKNYTNVKPQSWYFGPWMHVKQKIPQGDKGLASHFTVTEAMLRMSNFERVEHVTVTMNVEHPRRGDLSVELRSPTGIVSHLSTARRNDEAATGYQDWTFMSVAHWGESGIGDWTVVVKDNVLNDKEGTFIDWRIKLWGECIDPKTQGILPMPNEEDDNDHDRIDAPAHTITVSKPTDTATAPAGNPSDHQDRPVNSKTSGQPDAVTLSDDNTTVVVDPHASTAGSEGSTASPTSVSASTTTSFSVPTGTLEDEVSDPTTSPTSTDVPDTFLPSPFPTFGVSKKTQIWIYAALALILIFVVGIAAYLWLTRRRKRRNMRDAYEFDTLATDEDGAGMNGNGVVAGRGGKRKKRARELYDAFAEGSEEEEVFSLGDDDDDEYDDRRDEGLEGFSGRYTDRHSGEHLREKGGEEVEGSNEKQ